MISAALLCFQLPSLVHDGEAGLFQSHIVRDILPDLVDGDLLKEGGEIEIVVILQMVGAEPEAGAVEGGQVLEPPAQEAALDPQEGLLIQAVLRQESGLVEDAVSDLLGVRCRSVCAYLSSQSGFSMSDSGKVYQHHGQLSTTKTLVAPAIIW